jgi:hypothetical protein
MARRLVILILFFGGIGDYDPVRQTEKESLVKSSSSAAIVASARMCIHGECKCLSNSDCACV